MLLFTTINHERIDYDMNNIQLKNKYNRTKIVALFVLLLAGIFISTTIGPSEITIRQVIYVIASYLPGLDYLIELEEIRPSQETIIMQIRLPRIILAALVGMALATAGTTFQGLLKNPMADPFIIGISSGAALGAAFAIVTGLSVVIGYFTVPLVAFIGAVTSIFVVYHIARVGNKVPVYNLLLSGVALSSFLSAITSLLMILNTNEMNQILFWMLGSFSGRSWEHIQIAGPFIIFGIIALNFFSRELNLMLFGEHTAQNLGIDVERTKKLLLVLGSFTVASAVAVSGTIGFVGLIIPHSMRLIVGSDHRILMPVAALAGGIFMVFTDTIARTVISPTEIPVGIITALFGGPFFIYLLKTKKTIGS